MGWQRSDGLPPSLLLLPLLRPSLSIVSLRARIRLESLRWAEEQLIEVLNMEDNNLEMPVWLAEIFQGEFEGFNGSEGISGLAAAGMGV